MWLKVVTISLCGLMLSCGCPPPPNPNWFMWSYVVLNLGEGGNLHFLTAWLILDKHANNQLFVLQGSQFREKSGKLGKIMKKIVYREK